MNGDVFVLDDFVQRQPDAFDVYAPLSRLAFREHLDLLVSDILVHFEVVLANLVSDFYDL